MTKRPDRIETQRLLIRRPSVTDLADFLAYRNHEDRDPTADPMQAGAATAFLAAQAAFTPGEAGGWMMFAVEHRRTGRMIGEAGLFLSPPHARLGNIGWWIHPGHRGAGYATEAARAVLGYGFETLGLHRITAGCDPVNTGSRRVMERLGMRREGQTRQSRFAAGRWHDELLYALLRDEWREG